MENPKVKKILSKIFKTLKLSHKKGEYKKGKKCKVDNLYEYMTKKYNEFSKENESSDNEDNESDSESDSDSSDNEQEAPK